MQMKIGFVVEGDLDKAFIEALAPRLLGPTFRAYPVRTGGWIAVPWLFSTILTLLDEKSCQHVVVLLDANTSLEPRIDRKRREVEAVLEKHHLDGDDVSVCLVVPQLDAWLLAEYEEHPEESKDPRADLLQHLGTQRLTSGMAGDLAGRLDIAKARFRSPSFDAFARTLEHVTARLTQAPAA